MINLFEKIKTGQDAVSLIGLGYVGMPIAVAFANEGVKVVGFDLNKEKIELSDYMEPIKMSEYYAIQETRQDDK